MVIDRAADDRAADDRVADDRAADRLPRREHVTAYLAICMRGDAPPWDALQPVVPDEVFLAHCRYHGIAGLLHACMAGKAAWDTWPAPVRTALESEHRRAVATEMLVSHHLERLFAAFGRRGVRHVVMKGEALAGTQYRVPGTRAKCDVDVFIPVESIAPARAALVESGFNIVSPTYKSHQFTARRDSGPDPVQFDIHWRILNAPRYAAAISFEEAWRRSAARNDGPGIRFLDEGHGLLVACMHLDAGPEAHRTRLIWLYDIHLLFSAMGSEEKCRFAREAVARDVQRCCRDGLLQARQYFGTELPSSVRDILREPGQPRNVSTRIRSSQLGLLARDWRELRDWGDRGRLLAELFAPSRESLMQKYGKRNQGWLPWLYIRQITTGLMRRLTLR